MELRKVKWIIGERSTIEHTDEFYFHRWIIKHLARSTNETPYALIEDKDGKMMTVPFNQIRFIEKP